MSPKRNKAAFTLLELLLTLAVMGTVAAGAYYVSTTFFRSAELTALERDVRTINTAIRVYQSNGGTLPADASVEEVLAKLKTAAADRRIVGIRGAMIDSRLSVQYAQSSGTTVAIWDGATQRFRIGESARTGSGGTQGIVAFFDRSAGPGAIASGSGDQSVEDRRTATLFAGRDKWVWDYDGNAPAPVRALRQPGAADATTTTATGGADPVVLDPPIFSQPGGTYALAWYPGTVAVTKPGTAPDTVSDLFVRTDTGAWRRSSGSETVLPGTTLVARLVSLDPDRYEDSRAVSVSFATNPFKLQSGDDLRPSYRWAELGGPLAWGSVSTSRILPRLSLANADEIPDSYEDGRNLRMFWNFGSSSRVGGITDFSGGYPGETLPLTVDAFTGAATSVRVSHIAMSSNAGLFESGNVVNTDVAITATVLPAPVITPLQRSLMEAPAVSIEPDVTNAEIPAGVRIFYRLDGADPGLSNGEPLAGALPYTGDFRIPPDSPPTVTVTARLYAPAAHKKWFAASPPATRAFFVPYSNSSVYGVTGSDNSIYSVHPLTGATSVVNAAAPYRMAAIALDAAAAMLYYVQNGSESGAVGWRLGRYDIIAGTHTDITRLNNNGYNLTKQPRNLAYFGDRLYLIPDGTDDLVSVILTGTGAGTMQKVVDLLGNTAIFDRVGDLSTDDAGQLFFLDGDELYRADLVTPGTARRLGRADQNYDGLAFYKGEACVTRSGSGDISRMAASSAAITGKIRTAPERRFIDLAAPSSDPPALPSRSLWAVRDTRDGPTLIEIRNYRNPFTATVTDYGEIGYLDGTSTKYFSVDSLHRSGIEALAISSSGQAWLVRNRSTSVGGKTWQRGLFTINLNSLRVGTIPVLTAIGDLEPGLRTIAGTLDPDSHVTGLALAPDGSLYGAFSEGDTTGPESADHLFSVPARTTAGTLSVLRLGRMESSLGRIGAVGDIAFSPNGTLYASDLATGAVYQLRTTNGAVQLLHSTTPGLQLAALAYDGTDNRLVASAVAPGVQANTLRLVLGGTGSDEVLHDYSARWGLTRLAAAAFFQGAFLPPGTRMDVYAADGTTVIHGVDLDTGITEAVTVAPFPVKALGWDMNRKRLYYTENAESPLRLGMWDSVTGRHTILGDLAATGFAYRILRGTDSLAFAGGALYAIPRGTDDVISITPGDTAIQKVERVARLQGGQPTFDYAGDIAIDSEGWMRFSTLGAAGAQLWRYHLPTRTRLELLGDPGPGVVAGGGSTAPAAWFDALTFAPPSAAGVRLFGVASRSGASLSLIDRTTGAPAAGPVLSPYVNVLDFSDLHGDVGSGMNLTPAPQLVFNDLKENYTYADVGGTFVAGAVPAPAPAPVPWLSLLNAEVFPVAQQSSEFMETVYAFTTGDPRTTSGSVLVPPFSGGYPPVNIPLNPTLWTSGTLDIAVATRSRDTARVAPSQIFRASVGIQKTALRAPDAFEVTNALGQRQVNIVARADAGDLPPGTLIYYTTDGTDPGVTTNAAGLDVPVTGRLYTGPIPVPTTLPSGQLSFVVTARVYPPASLARWFSASISDYADVPIGLAGGHMDIDTASAVYPFRRGSTDGHVHEYDKKYNVTGVSFFNFATTTLKNIQSIVPAGARFKIIVANADLSPGGRLVINRTYNSTDPTTWTGVTAYDDTPLENLPVYSLDGQPGTTRLTEFGCYFDTRVIGSGALVPTVTGAVRSNQPGKYGEIRNGALTIQVVRVNPDGTDAFTTRREYSNGGSHGAATSGLIWESTFFNHWRGAAYGSAADPAAAVLVMDEDALSSGSEGYYEAPNMGTATNPRPFTAADLNEDLSVIGQRAPLRFFNNPANFGRVIVIRSGQVGDEGFFALETIPNTWRTAGPSADGIVNWFGDPFASGSFNVGPGLGSGSNPEALLDGVPDLTPLRASGLRGLIGRTVVAVLHDSDVSVNYSPLTGSLKGNTLGTLAFKVLEVKTASGFSSSTLPLVTIQVLNPALVFDDPRELLAAPAPTSSSVPMDTVP